MILQIYQRAPFPLAWLAIAYDISQCRWMPSHEARQTEAPSVNERLTSAAAERISGRCPAYTNHAIDLLTCTTQDHSRTIAGGAAATAGCHCNEAVRLSSGIVLWRMHAESNGTGRVSSASIHVRRAGDMLWCLAACVCLNRLASLVQHPGNFLCRF